MARKSRIRKRLTRQQLHDLDIEINFLEGLVVRDPDYTDALQILSEDYVARGYYDLALMVDEQLAEMFPGHPDLFFNLSCSYALNDQIKASLDALSLAIDYGFKDWKWIAREPGLETLRNDASYQEILAKIQSILTPSAK